MLLCPIKLEIVIFHRYYFNIYNEILYFLLLSYVKSYYIKRYDSVRQQLNCFKNYILYI